MNKLFQLMTALVVLVCASFSAFAADDAPAQILITNVRIFDGKSEALTEASSVLIENNMIKTVTLGAMDAPGATVIDSGGRTLMPGLIDNHVHLMLPGPTLPAMEANSTWEDIAIHGVAQSGMYLMQGFTTVRDAGGANGGLQRAINSGKIIGPRIYPSAAFIGGRGGHADFANFTAPLGDDVELLRV